MNRIAELDFIYDSQETFKEGNVKNIHIKDVWE